MSILDCHGQQRAIRTLQQARNARRIPHSYIFYGPEGVGKQLLATQWAKLLLCANPTQRNITINCTNRPYHNTPDQNIPTINPDTRPQRYSDIHSSDAHSDIHSDMGSYTHFDTLSDMQSIVDCCDKCPECHLVDTQNHPDLHIITRALGNFVNSNRNSNFGINYKNSIVDDKHDNNQQNNNGNWDNYKVNSPKKTTKTNRKKALLYLPVDVIREFVIAPASMYPVRHQAKIFIIPDAHTMNRAAQNALLKTLEEPQDKTFIILITSKPDLLLPTIHSRCQSIRFNTLSREYIYQQLLNNNIDNNQAAYWADFCQGQLGLALKLSSMGIFDWTEELAEKIALSDYGSALQLAQWLIEKSQLYGAILTENNNDFTSANATRQGYLYMLQSMAHIFNSVLRFSAKYQYQANQPRQSTLQTNSDMNKIDTFVAKIAGQLDMLNCCKAIEDIQQAEKLLAANVNPGLIFESLLLKYVRYTKKLIA